VRAHVSSFASHRRQVAPCQPDCQQNRKPSSPSGVLDEPTREASSFSASCCRSGRDRSGPSTRAPLMRPPAECRDGAVERSLASPAINAASSAAQESRCMARMAIHAGDDQGLRRSPKRLSRQHR
jgi:hypothetical protein